MALELVRVYIKRKLVVDHLKFNQSLMFKVGTAGLKTVKNRVLQAVGPTDGPAPPLKSKNYARVKSFRTGRRALRDLSYTGRMLESIQIRSVSADTAIANSSTRHGRSVGNANDAYFRRATGYTVIQQVFPIFQEAFRQLVNTVPVSNP